jgi:hypothetical protein
MIFSPQKLVLVIIGKSGRLFIDSCQIGLNIHILFLFLKEHLNLSDNFQVEIFFGQILLAELCDSFSLGSKCQFPINLVLTGVNTFTKTRGVSMVQKDVALTLLFPH